MEKTNVNYEPGAAEFARQLIGREFSDEDLAHLAGTLDGATVNVAVRQKKGWLYLAVDDPARFEVYETSVRPDANGELYGYIHEVRAASGQRGQGLGARAFARQVAGARSLGLKRFELWAAGNVRDTSYNGYYTWARFGFDARLATERAFLPPHLRGAKSINELILAGEQQWWKQHGTERTMIFEVHDGSSMMQVFRAYLKEKGLAEE